MKTINNFEKLLKLGVNETNDNHSTHCFSRDNVCRSQMNLTKAKTVYDLVKRIKNEIYVTDGVRSRSSLIFNIAE